MTLKRRKKNVRVKIVRGPASIMQFAIRWALRFSEEKTDRLPVQFTCETNKGRRFKVQFYLLGITHESGSGYQILFKGFSPDLGDDVKGYYNAHTHKGWVEFEVSILEARFD